MATAKTGIVLLGGVGMTARHLAKICSTLYPHLASATPSRAHARQHSVVQLVNANGFPALEDRLRRSLDEFSGGCIVHSVSGSAFFATAALAKWKDERVRGVIFDSIPQLRLEAPLLRLLGVPTPLLAPASALARAVLVSPLFNATLQYTDNYSELIRQPAAFGPRVLYAHSSEDEVVPMQQFSDFCKDLKAGQGSSSWGSTRVDLYVGKGKHAAMARDDAGFAAAVKAFLADSGCFAPGEV